MIGLSKGLYAKYGDRFIDTPLSEAAYVGAATCGLHPIAELMFIDFMGVCFDQILNQAAKFRYMLGGKAEPPRGYPRHGGRRFQCGGAAQPDAHPPCLPMCLA